jgi:hypothetical protein
LARNNLSYEASSQYIENGGTVLDENFIQAVERKIPKKRI